MSNDEFELKRRKDLLERELISKVQEQRKDNENQDKLSDLKSSSYAMKIASEFISATIVGAALGIFVDKAFGISPFALIFFIFVGFSSGVLNIVRSAGLSKTERLNSASKVVKKED
jgi:ATP synthase protein I